MSGVAAEAQSAEGRLARWIDEHGSERVRESRRLGAGDWQRIARDEYAAAVAATLPGGQWQPWNAANFPGGERERTLPELAELRLLAQVRGLAESSGLMAVNLGWMMPDADEWMMPDADEDGEEHASTGSPQYPILHADIVCPDGERRNWAVRMRIDGGAPAAPAAGPAVRA